MSPIRGCGPRTGDFGVLRGLSPWMAVPVAVPLLVVVAGEPYPLGHHGGNSAANLMVTDVGGVGTQDHDEEADGKGHVEDSVQCHCSLQAHEGQCRLLQEGCAAWGEDGTGQGSRGAGCRDVGHRDVGTQGHKSMGTWGYGD